MSKKRNWTAEEETYLKEAWGSASITYIAQKLHRSESAIHIRAQRMGLGAFTESGDYVTYLQLLRALYNNPSVLHSYTWTRELWTRNGLKIRQKKNRAFKGLCGRYSRLLGLCGKEQTPS